MSSRCVYAVVGILTLTVAYALWCRTPVIWDGAYQLNASLIMQQPYSYLTRFHSYFLWWPTVWASRVTSNIMLLQTIYGLPFLIAPVLAVALSWWMVHKDAPYLIIWPIFGVAAGSLPGQIFVINDSIFQLNLFWPIFMGMLVPLTWPKRMVLAICVVFQFSHPLGMLTFFGAALAMVFLTPFDSQNRKRLIFRAGAMVALALLAAAKFYIANKIPRYYDSYAVEEATWETAMNRWRAAVRGLPLDGLWFMWSSAAMLLIWMRWRGQLTESAVSGLRIAFGLSLVFIVWEHRHYGERIDGIFPVVACIAFFIFVMQFRRPSGPNPVMHLFPLLCAAVGAMCFIRWAGNGHLWWKALDYRRWVGPLSAPFFAMAVLDQCAAIRERYPAASSRAEPRGFEILPTDSAERVVVHSPPQTRQSLREPLAFLLAVTFLVVLGLQSTIWNQMSTRLVRIVKAYPRTVVPESVTPWIKESPLDHWATADYVMDMQGKVPSKLWLSPTGQEHIYANPPKIPHWDFYPKARANHPDPTPGPIGWFDLRPLLAKLAKEPRPKEFSGQKRLDMKTTPE